MYRLSTSTILINTGDKDLSGASKIELAIKDQFNRISYFTGSSPFNSTSDFYCYVSSSSNFVRIKLSQSDTQQIAPGTVSLQLRYLDANGVGPPSTVMTGTMDDVISSRILSV